MENYLDTRTVEEKKIAGVYIRVSTEDQARERIQFRRARGKVKAAM